MNEEMDPSGQGPSAAKKRFGRYLLLEAIDRGGMAEVYRAVAQGPGGFQRQFVIKRIRKEKASSKEFVDMFVNEARISALLDHPNIVQVYDFGQIEGDYFLAMEYLRGRNLLAVMKRLRSQAREMPLELAAFVTREVARGLNYAHSLNHAGQSLDIVHRDVTPSNIMLLRAGGVKLLDFGIARATMKLRSTTPTGGLIKGKLSYLSPEQVRGARVDGSSDVFSLGVVLWECLTGKRLFYDNNDLQTMRNVLEMHVPRPSELRPGVPAALDEVVCRMLERDPERRYARAGDLANDLEGYLQDCRFSPDSVISLLDQLFGEEESARLLPLPEISSSSLDAIVGAPASTASTRPLRGPEAAVALQVSDVAGQEGDGYATVSAAVPLPFRNRHRRRWLAGAAAVIAIGGAAALSIRALELAPLRSLAGTTTAPAAAASRYAEAAPPEVRPPTPPSPSPSAPPAEATAVSLPAETPIPEAEPAPAGAGRGRGGRTGKPAARLEMPANPPSAARGLEALKTGEFLRAAQELERVIRTERSNHAALAGLAEAEFELERHARALSHARRAAALSPRTAHYRILVGDAYFKLGRMREAHAAYAAAAALAPNDATTRARLARVKEKLGEQ